MARRRLSEQDVRICLSFLSHYDRHLYGTGAKLRRVADRLRTEAGVEISQRQLAKLRDRGCQFWGQRKGRHKRQSRTHRHTGAEWDRIIGWVRNHADKIDPRLDTPASVAMRMRWAGITVGSRAAAEALASCGIRLADQPAEWIMPATKQPAEGRATAA